VFTLCHQRQRSDGRKRRCVHRLGLTQPNSIAIDIYGNAWLTNTNFNVPSEFSSTGTGATGPVAIAINPY
jgi:hypothetical protein